MLRHPALRVALSRAYHFIPTEQSGSPKKLLATDHLWRIVLKKSFLGDEGNVLGPLMLFALGDLRDHIVLPKNDHGPSYQRQRGFAAMETSKISFHEIFGVVGFSTFSTVSATRGHLRLCQKTFPRASR